MNNYREPQMNVRVYLNIPFNDKDNAKDMGCKWDMDRKKWYCIDSDYGKSNVSKYIQTWDNTEPYKIINGTKILLSNISTNNRGYTN